MSVAVRSILVLQLIVLSLALCVPASADTPAPPRDYAKETEDGQYIFIMLAPPERWVSKDAELRKTYKTSGLYRNDGSTTPLWTVYWYSFSVYPSSDGRHIVRMGPWASSVDQLALAFYEDGKELKSYRIRDLVKNQLKLKHTVSHFFWQKELKFNDKENTILIKTHDDQTYLFSVKTGEIQKE
ncbi:MAG: hypothetical protein A4E60_01800 [Syntrophorhabdus sp. PtaB.Bin047]|nr:MAG: hypothetical protein A4E60_01800 [Syntrophorhabdus sp. PtaB.Bin047]